MKTYATLFFLSLIFPSFCQTSQSPDGKFSFTRTSKDLGDHFHWKGALIDLASKDSLLIINNFTHDNPPPIAHWSESRLVFNEGDTIKVYNTSSKKVIYAERGLIWNYTENYFDDKNNYLFFLRSYEPDRNKYELILLKIGTLKEHVIESFIASGYPITGIPSILKADFDKRELLIEIESKDLKSERFTVKY